MWWVYKNYHDERNGTSLTFSYLWFYTMVLHNDSTLYPGPGKEMPVGESGAVSPWNEVERRKWAFGLPIASILPLLKKIKVYLYPKPTNAPGV